MKLRTAAIGSALVLAATAAACSGDQGSGPTPAPAPSATSAAPSPSRTPSPTPTPSPTKADYDPISGGKKVDDVVVAVKIDNVAQARPQVGLGQADMVVIERVEADLTRLMAIYHTEWPKRVGPVRSARNTDVQLLPMFGKPALVYSGANGKVSKQIRSSPYLRPIQRDKRDYSRPAPHNVVIDLNHVKQKDDIGKAKPMGYTFGEGEQWKSAAKQASIDIPVGVDDFSFRYADGHYGVSVNGDTYRDGDTDDPVLADNIVRIKTTAHKDPNTTSDLSEVVETIGTGQVTVYSRGKKISGSWDRPKINSPMTLKTDDGKDIELKPGQTWIVLDG